jgi:cellulose synthase/poly-beta-1,6-N-acetylglucosamine synthase-like glycosyltransferase
LGVAKEPIISDYDNAMEIPFLIGLLLILAAAFYLLVHLGLIAGLKRSKYTKNHDQPFVSIIVAARNEGQTISHVLQCLLQQTYMHCEIIIVNDRSTDTTAHIIADFQKTNSNIKRIDIATLPTDMPAKKNALRAGIGSSKGDILCFTDADCFPPPMWIEELVELFEPEVGLVAGYSPYQIPSNQPHGHGLLNNLFFKFIAYEEFRAAIWSAGSIGWNIGWLCTGRNLAYRRKVYDEVGGFEKIKMSMSGDDDLFLQLMRRQTAWKIRYAQKKETFVPTVPPNNYHSFIEQRKRHFSAAKFFTLPMMLFFFFYHTSNLLLFVSPLFFLFGLLSFPVVIANICIKLIADAILISSSAHIFDGGLYRFSYMLMESLYIFYNTCIGPLGIIRKFTWKQI